MYPENALHAAQKNSQNLFLIRSCISHYFFMVIFYTSTKKIVIHLKTFRQTYYEGIQLRFSYQVFKILWHILELILIHSQGLCIRIKHIYSEIMCFQLQLQDTDYVFLIYFIMILNSKREGECSIFIRRRHSFSISLQNFTTKEMISAFQL